MPASTRICLSSLQEEIDLYKEVLFASWIMAAANVLLYLVCFRRRLQGAPAIAAQYLTVTGAMKVVMGILIAFLFVPQCPDNCDPLVCQNASIPSVFYSLICSLVGLIWLQQGYAHAQRAQVLENGKSEGIEDTMFQEVPTVEIVSE